MLLQHKEGISLRYFDLHCDTMTECFLHDKHLKENDLHVNLQKAQAMETYAQCYAVWIPDNLRGDAAFQRFCEIADRFQEEAAANIGGKAGEHPGFPGQGRENVYADMERGK